MLIVVELYTNNSKLRVNWHVNEKERNVPD
jgi:hypothetical protein